ncbi:MAG: T9SS type A sorting domain-containing protein [Bacteroidales bacterium]|nr:T9SS type A sorting domain-containing protein [Bacteroidales bacterium]
MKNLKRIFLFFLFIISFTGSIYAQIYGCTDTKANNYNPLASNNDGSCTYDPTFYKPIFFINFPDAVGETSGLIFYNNGLWTHNDSGGDAKIFKIDTLTSEIVQTIYLPNASNYDWEDITQDEDHIYIADVGNNEGNRKNLRIYKVNKNDIPISGNANVNSTIIHFSYSDQTNFSSANQKNNYDCEAIISCGDHLYLFSKNWENYKTKLYKLPKIPGNYEAALIDSLEVDGLITGADYKQEFNEISLIAYKNYVPFLFLLYNYQDNNFFSGNKRRIDLPYILGAQTEGITYSTDKNILISCENSVISQQVFKVNTGIWTNTSAIGINELSEADFDYSISPNPVTEKKFKIDITNLHDQSFTIEFYDSLGQNVNFKKKKYSDSDGKIKLSFKVGKAKSGLYLVKLRSSNQYATRKLIIQ